MTRHTILLAALILSLSAVAHAEAPLSAAEGSPGGLAATDHVEWSSAERGRAAHQGLMLRMGAGFGVFGAGIQTQDAVERGVGGAGPALNLLVGATIAPNLALHADVMLMGADYARSGVEGERHTKRASGLGLLAGGFGATYFFRRYDISLTASALYASMSFDSADGYSYSSDAAVLGKFDVTKEWALSDVWGMGLGASVFAGYARGVDSEQRESDSALGGVSLNAVATYL